MARSERDKVQIGIYQIDKSLFGGKSDDEIVEFVIESYNKKVGENEKFNPQNLSSNFDGFTIKVFYAEKLRTPKWNPFLAPILDQNAPLLKGRNKDASYIAFIYNSENLFAISGGQGNFTVQDYIDQNFGIEILTRLISKDSKVIKSLQDRGVTGSVLGSTKFFRGDYKLSDEDEFGKIYKQIKAELDTKILTDIFEFTEDEVKKNSGCLAKSSFQINKSITFEALLRILTKIDGLLKEEKKFTLNKVLLIPRRGKSNKDLIKELTSALNKHLYDTCKNNGEVDFDFCHPNFDDYLTAEDYKIFKGAASNPVYESTETIDNAHKLLQELKEKGVILLEDEQKFTDSLGALILVTFDGDGKRKTWKKVFNHLHGEIELNGKTYFFIDNEWYEIRDTFVDELNADCKYSISQSISADILPESFDENASENDYSKKYLNKDGYIVLDKITPENIEFSDILKSEDGKIYVVHIKKSFNNSIRELTAQALISARRLVRDRKSDKSFLTQLDKDVKEGRTNGTNEYSAQIKGQSIPDGGIKTMFEKQKDSDIIFCIGIMDTIQEDRNLANDISKYKSNIAKFSILELEKNLRALGLGFAIAHIKRGS